MDKRFETFFYIMNASMLSSPFIYIEKNYT